MVLHSSGGDVDEHNNQGKPSGRSDTVGGTIFSNRAGTTITISRLADLRQQYEHKKISSTGTQLLLASWRMKSSKSYGSFWKMGVIV